MIQKTNEAGKMTQTTVAPVVARFRADGNFNEASANMRRLIEQQSPELQAALMQAYSGVLTAAEAVRDQYQSDWRAAKAPSATDGKRVPAAESLQRERSTLAAVVQAEEAAGLPHFERRAAITDPVITPFVRALVSDGFEIKKDRGDCDALGTCPVCRGRYLYTAIKDGIELQLCPHCRDTQDRKGRIA
ncbi:hypothetical protein P3T23_009370 [Paraburkholderia sp. GAS448]|uniref:hypothetical protein n=1 Tax=Paraburkholderia sp. GAS448 TaxID=3035136 RepID=UPI003D210C7D